MKLILLSLIILLTTVVGTPSGQAQGSKNFSQKLIPIQGSIQLREDAALYYEMGKYETALPLYEKLSQRYPGEVDFVYKTGVCFLYMPGQAQNSITFLEKVLLRDPNREGLAFNLGKAYHANSDFDLGIKYFDFLLSNKSLATADRALISRLRKSCEVGKELVANALDILVANMGETLNSEGTEYVPLLSSDESTLIFTYRAKNPNTSDKEVAIYYSDDIFISYKRKGAWTQPKSISTNINTKNEDEAAVGISSDGKQIFILKYNEETSGDIYSSSLKSDGWTVPTKLKGDVNTNAWEGSACVSKNGKLLYFDSEREGGLGGTDIYSAELQKDGSWSNVTNLGDKINTPFNDEAAFINADSKTLYFSSDGHKTMGGFDIFKSIKDKSGNWSSPQNLGYPINTVANDKYYVSSADGKRGYYHQDNPNGYGGLDLYMVDYDKPAIKEKPVVVATTPATEVDTKSDPDIRIDPNYVDNEPISISGTVKSDGNTTISRAKIKLRGDDKSVLGEVISDRDGKFAFKNVKKNKHYNIEIVIAEPKSSNPTAPNTGGSKTKVSEDRKSTSKPKPTRRVELSGDIRIANLTLCEDVQNHAPVRASESFSVSLGKVFFHTEVNLGVGVEGTITHKWYFNDVVVQSVELNVKGPRWRTFSYKSIDSTMKGAWKVEVLSGGSIIAEKEFKVQ